MDKAAQLREALERLAAKDAVRLARSVELARAQRRELLPTDVVLDGLRAKLRLAEATRVPDLRRLVSVAFEPFLTDRADDPRIPGWIPRSSLVPWWSALEIVAHDELEALAARLAALLPDGSPGAFEDLVADARKVAGATTTRIVADLARSKADPALRKLLAGPLLGADIEAMATLLEIAEPLAAGIAAVDRVLEISDKLEGRRIVDFSPEAVTAAKQHYVTLSDEHGMASRFLALAILNRLNHQWQILRLGRALSWKPNDSLLRDTEFGVVGERLITDLQQASRDIVARVMKRRDLPDLATLSIAMGDYMQEVEGLLGEFGFRRDSPWGEAILETRTSLAQAMNPDWLARVANEAVLERILPTKPRKVPLRDATPDIEILTQPEETLADAIEAARFLLMCAQRGARHGLGQARDTVEHLGADIDERTQAQLERLHQSPGDPLAEAQIAAASRVLDMLFEDGRGDILARRGRIANQAIASTV